MAFFVVLAEVLISRAAWLEEKLGAAHLAVLASGATPFGMVGEMLRNQLLSNADVVAIVMRRGPVRLVLSTYCYLWSPRRSI
tara:strand:+ start:454 stop:699 length:246 start_codon:yes stop_codon:yes gene_type:complete